MKNENIPEEKDARKGFSDESGLVRFTAPPESVEMDKTYSDFINSLVQDVHKTRISVVLASNSAMITLYWNIGNEILKKLESVSEAGSEEVKELEKELNDIILKLAKIK